MERKNDEKKGVIGDLKSQMEIATNGKNLKRAERADSTQNKHLSNHNTKDASQKEKSSNDSINDNDITKVKEAEPKFEPKSTSGKTFKVTKKEDKPKVKVRKDVKNNANVPGKEEIKPELSTEPKTEVKDENLLNGMKNENPPSNVMADDKKKASIKEKDTANKAKKSEEEYKLEKHTNFSFVCVVCPDNESFTSKYFFDKHMKQWHSPDGVYNRSRSSALSDFDNQSNGGTVQDKVEILEDYTKDSKLDSDFSNEISQSDIKAKELYKES